MSGRLLSTVRCIALLALSAGAHAQLPWSFQQVSTADGLTDNAINCLYQDRAGFLWIGTESGLNKYDGHHVWTWRRSEGLSGDQVSGILEDGSGTVWVATRDGGLTRMDQHTHALRVFRHDARDPASIATDRLTCLFDLDDTTLMIGAEQVPILFLDKRTLHFRYWSGSGPIAPAQAVERVTPTSDWCHTIQQLDDRQLLISFLLAHRECIVDRHSGVVLEDAFVSDTYHETTTSITRVGDRVAGVGWQRALLVRALAAPNTTVANVALPDEGTCLLALDSAHLLIGTKASGLLRFDVATGTWGAMHHQRTDRRTLADDRIRCLLRDHAQRIWVGTETGLSVFDPAHAGVSAVPLFGGTLNGPDLTAFRIDTSSDGRAVVCTTDGLFVLEHDGSVAHQQLQWQGMPLRTTGLFPTPDGLFLGTEEGPFRCTPTPGGPLPISNELTRLDGDTLFVSLFQVRSAYADAFGQRHVLVVGAAGYGLTWFDLASGKITALLHDPNDASTLGNNLTRQVLRTRDGTYWVATAGGLFRWRLDRARPANTFAGFRSGTGVDALPGNDVRALAEDQQGRLLVATRDGGLCRIAGGHVQALPCPRALGNTQFGLAVDQQDRAWCTTADGIEVYDPHDGSWWHVPVPGMTGPAALNGTMTMLADGRIGCVAENTLFLLDPARVLRGGPVPEPYLTGLDILGTQVMERLDGGVLALSPDERSLTIALSTLQLTAPGPVHFLVRLEGIEPTPRLADAQGRIGYSSLPPGDFRVLVRTVDASGRMSAERTLLTVHVAAPVWQRWWFFLLVAAGAGGVVLLWSRYRLRQALKLHAVRDRIASDLHDEVGSSLSAITIGSQLAAQLSRSDSAQVKDLMARIGETSDASLRSMSDIVWAIDPRNDQGDALVKRMQRIAHELLQTKGIEVVFAVSEGLEEIKLRMDARKDLVLLFKEAVHNASKYSKARSVKVALQRRRGRLLLTVQDDGAGFDPGKQGEGHGLGSMRRRAAALGGELLLISAPGQGTLVGVELDLTGIRD